jgi:hypothetical protein
MRNAKELSMKKSIVTLSFLILSVVCFAQGRKAPLTREEQLNAEYCSGLFSTIDGTYFDLANDDNALSVSGYFNVLNWLQGRVAGLQVYNYRGTPIPFIRNSPAAIYVDEMRVDATFLDVLPVSDIAMIKVIKTPFLGLWGASGGAIAIYTKDGEEVEEEI